MEAEDANHARSGKHAGGVSCVPSHNLRLPRGAGCSNLAFTHALSAVSALRGLSQIRSPDLQWMERSGGEENHTCQIQ